MDKLIDNKNDDKSNSCVFYFFNENEIINEIPNKKKTYKMIKINFFTKNELTIHRKILKINNRKQYFYICENDSELKKLGTKSKNDTILLEFEERELTNFKKYLNNISNDFFTSYSSKMYVSTIICFYKNICKSLQILIDNKICHNYINFNSIVIDNSNRPLLTNFSFSIDYSNINNMNEYIKKFIITYDPCYIEWPIELHILSYLLTNKLTSLSEYNIENIINEVVKNNNILNTFGDSLVSLYKQESLNYFKKYVNQTYEFIVSDILKYIYTWDNYALSILYLRILISLHKTIQIKNKFIILFMKLLVNNIHLNPEKRLSIDETINNFNSLLDSIDPQDYKDIIQNLID
jgi:hypothetical protein